MNNKTKTFRFFTVITALFGLNLLILGKSLAQNQVASLDVQPGNLTLAVPSSISFDRTILLPGNSVKETKVLRPTDELQTVEVIDPSTGNQFHVNVTMQNLGAPGQSMATDPTLPVGPLNVSDPMETINVGNANAYFVNDTVIVNQNGTSNPTEHMKVVSVNPTANQITVKRGIDDTAIYAVPINQGTGLTTTHVMPLNQFSIITLHGGPTDSVDTSIVNNPPGTNNVSSDSNLNYYYDVNNSPMGYPDSNYTAFTMDAMDPNPDDTNVSSTPITIMQRTIDTMSSGIYSVGLALRANIPAGSSAGDFSGELTFTLDP